MASFLGACYGNSYFAPKGSDGSAYESTKYAERRDDMGRLMLTVMMQAGRLAAADEPP